jgi:hypothetical protein
MYSASPNLGLEVTMVILTIREIMIYYVSIHGSANIVGSPFCWRFIPMQLTGGCNGYLYKRYVDKFVCMDPVFVCV